MLIPNHIHLLGHKIRVVWKRDLVFTDEALGKADYRKHIIFLQEPCDAYDVPDTLIYQVYMHEVLHFILTLLGETQINDDERLVDNIAGLLAQATKGDYLIRGSTERGDF